VTLRSARRSPRTRLTAALVLALPIALAGAQAQKSFAPETFKANGQITGAAGGAATAMTIAIDKYTSDADHQKLADTLKSGGQAAFLAALKKSPAIGKLTIGARSFTIRWARSVPSGDHRRVAAVTDAPIFFAGAGAVDAKPTAGYELGVFEFTIDSVGLGTGTMAPAAKVKAGGETGVEIEDYSGKRVELMTVTRQLK
jgi:hypothetical protein